MKKLTKKQIKEEILIAVDNLLLAVSYGDFSGELINILVDYENDEIVSELKASHRSTTPLIEFLIEALSTIEKRA